MHQTGRHGLKILLADMGRSQEETQCGRAGDSMAPQESLEEILSLFAEEFRRGRIFSGRKRVSVKEYPARAAEALSGSGFVHEVQDYVLYR